MSFTQKDMLFDSHDLILIVPFLYLSWLSMNSIQFIVESSNSVWNKTWIAWRRVCASCNWSTWRRRDACIYAILCVCVVSSHIELCSVAYQTVYNTSAMMVEKQFAEFAVRHQRTISKHISDWYYSEVSHRGLWLCRWCNFKYVSIECLSIGKISN